MMVEPLHVLLEVLPEGQERFFHFALELPETKTDQKSTQGEERRNRMGNSAEVFPKPPKIQFQWLFNAAIAQLV